MNTRLVKISDFIWELPISYKKGMRVPVRIIASEKLIEKLEEVVFDQAANTATLPGLVGHVILLPDAHSGYGASIGTVFATDPENGGVISPGAVGYDINCLPGETEILTNFGYRRKIIDFEKVTSSLTCINLSTKKEDEAPMLWFLKKYTNPHLIEITTSLGYTIHATSDHPIYTYKGMKQIELLQSGDHVSIFPFTGVFYEEPSNEEIVSEDSIRNLSLPFVSEYSREYLIRELKKRSLLPLRYNSPQLPYLIKLVAFNMGDGNLTFTHKTQLASFWSKPEDLEKIASDIKYLGYHAVKFSRKRKHTIKTVYGEKKFETKEFSLHTQSGSFVVLLHALGAPIGNKTRQNYRVSEWLNKTPLWQKRLFLAAYFGAEMSSPKVMVTNQSNFYMPTISVNKSLENLKSGYYFLNDLKNLLNDFGIATSVVREVDEHIGRTGRKSRRLRLQIMGDNNNLTRLYSQVGFEYNKEKKFLANVAVHYLKFKEKILDLRSEIEKQSKRLYQGRGTEKNVFEQLVSEYVSERFIHRSIFEKRKTRVRIPPNFPKFKDFLLESTKDLKKSGTVWDTVESIEKITFSGYVYDFTVNHPSHNFIANNFVVSNCGMRLIATNLTVNEVRPKLSQLVNLLFDYIPPGVGREGFLRVTYNEMDEIAVEGAKWMVKKGFGWEDDLKKIEEGGNIAGSNPSKVSQKAKERGKLQLATLGSGNHYLEIQKVENIFEKEKAKELGINHCGQVVVMLHCGSRGFGHQIATDYLRSFEKKLDKYGIKLADLQLACAPFNSPDGQNYFAAMNCAANFAFANRQAITYQIREVFEKVFGKNAQSLGMKLIYDVAHNIAKIEEHITDNIEHKTNKLVVHRKGATRSFPNQPVIIGGSMETGSYLLVGTEKALEVSFGSTAHGSGRTMSRHQAKREVSGEGLLQRLAKEGIIVKSATFGGLAEEAGVAYKNIADVVESISKAGISTPIASFKPIGNIKG